MVLSLLPLNLLVLLWDKNLKSPGFFGVHCSQHSPQDTEPVNDLVVSSLL